QALITLAAPKRRPEGSAPSLRERTAAAAIEAPQRLLNEPRKRDAAGTRELLGPRQDLFVDRYGQLGFHDPLYVPSYQYTYTVRVSQYSNARSEGGQADSSTHPAWASRFALSARSGT